MKRRVFSFHTIILIVFLDEKEVQVVTQLLTLMQQKLLLVLLINRPNAARISMTFSFELGRDLWMM